MNLITYIYKTKTLSDYGRFILIALIVLLVAGYFLIPEYPVQDQPMQILSLKGKYIVFDDDPQVSEFIRSVKRNGGYICLGTSETTPRKDGNYYDFLDQDTSFKTRFSKLAGAGWTCGLHMPMLILHKEEVDSLNLIYFINPVYWRSELSQFNKGYWTRYLNYGLYRELLKENNVLGFQEISDEYHNKINPGEKMLYCLKYWLRKIRKPFFRDLRYLLFPEKYYEELGTIATVKVGFETFDHPGDPDLEYIDTIWNTTHDFKSKAWLNPIAAEEYRFLELKAFNDLCNQMNVNVTYVLGPVNEIFIRKYKPTYLEAYISTQDKIRELLESEDADYIDATEIGNIPGSFEDNQHHSSYGAFLIYEKIKNHLNEKNGL